MTTATFEQRLEAARVAIVQRYRWSAPTVLALKPVEKGTGTFSVDKWNRLYFNRSYADALTDAEFVGALWHEVNHLLRRHGDRFPTRKHHKQANIAADAEINGELRGKVTLPKGCVYPELFGETQGKLAEDYFAKLVQDAEERAEERRKQRAEKQESDDVETDDGEENDDGQEDGQSDSPGDGTSEDDADTDGDGTESDSGSGGSSTPSDADGEDGDASNDGGDGSPDDSVGDSPGGNDGADDKLDDDGLPDTGCGSGAGGDDDGELPEPSEEEQAETEQREREQAEAVLDAANDSSGRGPGNSVIDAARQLLGKTGHDWRATFAHVVRAAYEQASDDAEEYTFRRVSRRAYASAPAIVPGTFRPTPLLTVVVDGSGSMDADKVASALTECREILTRLAIPSFVGHMYSDGSGYNYNRDTTSTFEDGCDGHVPVSTESHVRALFDYFTGGGTDMMAAIRHAAKDARGRPEVIVVLTDAECGWDTETPCPGVPVIVGGVNAPDTYVAQLPSWVTYVDVMPTLDANGNVLRRGGHNSF